MSMFVRGEDDQIMPGRLTPDRESDFLAMPARDLAGCQCPGCFSGSGLSGPMDYAPDWVSSLVRRIEAKARVAIARIREKAEAAKATVRAVALSEKEKAKATLAKVKKALPAASAKGQATAAAARAKDPQGNAYGRRRGGLLYSDLLPGYETLFRNREMKYPALEPPYDRVLTIDPNGNATEEK